MTTSQIILSIIEILAVCLVVVGMFNETRIAKWERRMFKRICLRIIRAYDRRQEKKAVQARKTTHYKRVSPKIVYSGYSHPAEQHFVA